MSLPVVSNFGDGDCGADEIHTRARKFEETRREGSAEKLRLLEISRARVYFVLPTIAIAKIRDYSQSRYLRTFGFITPFKVSGRKISVQFGFIMISFCVKTRLNG